MRARAVGHNSFPTEYNYHYHHIFIIVYVFAFAAFLATPATAREKHVISHNYCAHTENGTQKLETHYVRCGAPSPSPFLYIFCVCERRDDRLSCSRKSERAVQFLLLLRVVSLNTHRCHVAGRPPKHKRARCQIYYMPLLQNNFGRSNEKKI